MKKYLMAIAALLTLSAAAPAMADAESGANGNGSDMTSATTIGGWGSR